MLVEEMTLGHHGPDRNHRPYLHLSGELRSVRPVDGTWAYGIKEVVYSPGLGERVDAFYEFDDTQLGELVTKGYFLPGFSLPKEIIGIEWELPATVDTLVVAPDPAGAETDIPLVFLEVRDLNGLEVTMASSGYDVAAYFHDQSEALLDQRETPSAPMAPPAKESRIRSGDAGSLLSGDLADVGGLGDPGMGDGDLSGSDLGDGDLGDGATAVSEELVGTASGADLVSDFRRQLQEAEEVLDREELAARRRRESEAGTLENLYAQRVGMQMSTSPETLSVTIDPAGATDGRAVSPASGSADVAAKDPERAIEQDPGDEHGTDLEL
ncbi:hypothetical protein OG984_03150 [Nocardioides sp. NBC_00368]|uniref:hypothetical protein n=1 Tax=Nocardioides sp. NBC_00368 TaxID=2976000 RepID=UPI002E243021